MKTINLKLNKIETENLILILKEYIHLNEEKYNHLTNTYSGIGQGLRRRYASKLIKHLRENKKL